jgi:hypothetical protein
LRAPPKIRQARIIALFPPFRSEANQKRKGAAAQARQRLKGERVRSVEVEVIRT